MRKVEESMEEGDTEELGWDSRWGFPLKDRCGDLLATGFGSDFVLKLGPQAEEMKVHKIFLQTGSQILYMNMMDNGTNGIANGGGEDNGHGQCHSHSLSLPEVDPSYFKLLVTYLYTGTSGATMADALPLLKLASDFEVWGLKDQCSEMLKGELTDENALSLFQTAHEYANKELIKSSLDYICRNAVRMLSREEFSSIGLGCLVEIIQQDDLQVEEEIEVFDAVYKWGLEECKRKNLDETDSAVLQKVLSKPLKSVRFPLMDQEKFALNVATKNVLSTEENTSLLLCFLVSEKNRSTLPAGKFSSKRRNYFRHSFTVSRMLPEERLSPSQYPPLVMPNEEITDEIIFAFFNHKYPLHLTEITFLKESLVSCDLRFDWCGGKFHKLDDNLVVKVQICELKSDDHDYKIENTDYFEEGKLVFCVFDLEGLEGYRLKLNGECPLKENRYYKVQFTFDPNNENTSTCEDEDVSWCKGVLNLSSVYNSEKQEIAVIEDASGKPSDKIVFDISDFGQLGGVVSQLKFSPAFEETLGTSSALFSHGQGPSSSSRTGENKDTKSKFQKYVKCKSVKTIKKPKKDPKIHKKK